MPTRLARLLAFVFLSVIAFCGCSTFVVQNGKCRADDVVRIETWYRYYLFVGFDGWIDSIDGAVNDRVFGGRTNAAEICPGSHWLQIRDERHIGLGGGLRSCALETDFKGGYSYQFLAHSLETDAPRLGTLADHVYPGTISVEIRAPDGRAIIKELPVACVHSLSEFCKEDRDCRNGLRCMTDDRYAFGLCRRPESLAAK